MDACSQCPHPNDCLKVGSCLDELNAPFIKIREAPRLMTPEQANTCIAVMREGKSDGSRTAANLGLPSCR